MFITFYPTAFLAQAITGQWASPFPPVCENLDGVCEVQIVEQAITPKAFAWFISTSLVGTAIMRLAEALESNGRYLLARYDITGCKLTPRRAQYTQGTKPNGFKVMLGVQLWTKHFTCMLLIS